MAKKSGDEIIDKIMEKIPMSEIDKSKALEIAADKLERCVICDCS